MTVRVLIVAPWGERLGGAEEMLWLALRNFDPERVRPTVVFLGEGEFAAEVAALGIETEVIPAGRLRNPLSTARALGRLTSLLRRTRPDLVLDWSAKTQLYGATAALAAGIPSRVLWWQHQVPDGHWLDRVATLLPAQAIGCSSRAGQEAQARLRPRRPTFVVNPGVEARERAPEERERLRTELGIPAERSVVGLVGRLQPWKGQDRFVEALARLGERGADVHGLLVGGDAYELSPDYAAEVRRKIARLGLDGRVTMTGQVDDAGAYFEAMEVAVNASEEEPFGIVLLEAMEAGVPVVAVGRGGPLEIVERDVTGTLAESGEPAALAAAIERTLADSGRRTEMGEAARRRCRERFGAAAMAERLTDELVELAGG